MILNHRDGENDSFVQKFQFNQISQSDLVRVVNDVLVVIQRVTFRVVRCGRFTGTHRHSDIAIPKFRNDRLHRSHSTRHTYSFVSFFGFGEIEPNAFTLDRPTGNLLALLSACSSSFHLPNAT